jgi:hypothetical protein
VKICSGCLITDTRQEEGAGRSRRRKEQSA